MVTRQAPAVVAPLTSAHTFPGTAAQAAVARRWVREVVGSLAGADVADPAEFAVAELLANAVQHSLSGRPGGTVAVIITCGPDGVMVHVHDQGTGGVVPRPRDAGHDAEDGRGLRIVELLSAAWGTGFRAACSHAGADGLTAVPGGCTWFACRPENRTGGQP